jgi:hypothetical protein
MDDPTFARARGSRPAQVYLTFGLWLSATTSAVVSAYRSTGFGIYFAMAILIGGISFCLLGIVFFGRKSKE